jgi:hypothetical protein
MRTESQESDSRERKDGRCQSCGCTVCVRTCVVPAGCGTMSRSDCRVGRQRSRCRTQGKWRRPNRVLGRGGRRERKKKREEESARGADSRDPSGI